MLNETPNLELKMRDDVVLKINKKYKTYGAFNNLISVQFMDFMEDFKDEYIVDK